MTSGRPSPSAILTVVLLAALATGSIWESGPPPPSGPRADATEFSTVRAMEHVEEIAQRPHPMGSADHARVREYLVRELQNMRLAVEHQQTVVTRVYLRGGSSGPVRTARVHNLLTRIHGAESTGAILIASHYDSVPAGPGAADAASCVAAILEAVRALREGPPLRNDVIVLFSDGEEDGLLGASAFVDQHPWAKDVRFILNFEARGTGGPSQMFETSTGNGRIVGEWAGDTPFATGSSLGYEIYKRLPNDTDFTMFKRLNAEGLNFAFIDNVEAYHTPADAPGALDQGSLQAHGTTALAMLRRFGDLDIGSLDARDAVFFSLPLGFAWSYSTLWVLPLTGLMAVAWVIIMVRQRRQGLTSVGGIIVAILIQAALVAGAVFAGLRFNRLPSWLHERWLAEGAVSTNAAYALCLVCLLAGIWLAVQSLLRRWLAAHTLALGALFVWVIVAGALSWWLPGASYLVHWPLAAALVAGMLLPADARKQAPSPLTVVLLWALAAPGLAIIAPTAASLFSAVGIGTEGGAALAVCTMLALGTLAPQLELAREGRRWWPAVVTLLAGAGALAAGAWTAPYGTTHPKPVNVLYALDADAGRAEWATGTSRMHPWLEQFVTAEPQRGPLPMLAAVRGSGAYWHHEAPVVAIAGPEAVLKDDTTAGGDRLITLRVSSPRGGRTISVQIPDATVVDTWIGGQRVGGAQGGPPWEQGLWSLEYVNPPDEGFQLQIRIKGQVPVTVRLADRSHALPEIPGRTFEPRPRSLTTVQNGDMTIVTRAIRF